MFENLIFTDLFHPCNECPLGYNQSNPCSGETSEKCKKFRSDSWKKSAVNNSLIEEE